MITLKLMVQRASIDTHSQDWGDFTFVSSPSPGDRIAADHGGTTHYLTVLIVHHHPAALASHRTQKIATEPSANVVAIWTGSNTNTA